MASPFDTAQSLRIDIDELVATANRSLTSPSGKGAYSPTAVRQLITPLLNQHKGLKPALTIFYNAFASICSELKEGDLRPSAALTEMKLIQRKLVEAEQEYVTTLGNYADRQDDNMSSLMSKNQKVRTRLQSEITKKPLLFTTAPVLPMVSLNREKLAHAGIRFQNLQGYASLEEQRVIGISYDYVTKRLERIVQDTKDAVKLDPALLKNMPKSEKDLDKLFDLALGAISQSDSQALKLLRNKEALVNHIFKDVLDTFMAKNPGYIALGTPLSWWRARWYWVIPRTELAHLRNCSYGGSFAIDKWDFAFAARNAAK